MIVYRAGDEHPQTLTPPEIDTAGEQARHFLAAVRGEQPPFVSADDGIAAVRVALGAYESSNTGRTVKLD